MRAILAEKNKDAALTLTTDPDDILVVTMERFGKMCEFFGPVKDYLVKLKGALMNDWFFGEISKDEAESRLRDQPSGTYLARLSSTEAGCFTVSKVSRKGNINHQRIQYDPKEGNFAISNTNSTSNKGKKYNCIDLHSFITMLAEEWNLVTACPGSPFKSLYNKGPVLDGYLLADSDKEEESSDDGSD